ncbi:hypothetical protein EDC04DRAFT_2606782 [Pisolithus marmoratus]|nr:hypothetical protein EDC04DRAFT_2606782 [Pisolithus marmoratus]
MGIEPFSGRILWIHIWHSNRNLQLILTYFLDAVDKLGFIPLITQSDPGSENYSIANAQTMLCQWHNPAPEILEYGVHKGWFDIDNTLQLFSYPGFKQSSMPIKIIVPELIFSSPQDYGALDLKACYNDLGHPAVTCHTAWDICLDLLHAVQDHALSLLHLLALLSTPADADDSLPLIEGQHNLPFNDSDDGYYYMDMGGVSGGLGLDKIHACHLNELDNAEDEPDVIEEGSNIVVSDFSDEEALDSKDDWS